jgi:hypothetical protein
MQRNFYLLLVVAFLSFACGSVKMTVSDDLKANNDEYVVKGKDGTRIKQKLSFGNYYTTGIHRSWVRDRSSKYGIASGNVTDEDYRNIISLTYINRKQTIRYGLTDGNHNSEVFCVSRFNARDLEIGKHPGSILNIGIDLLGITGRPESSYYVQIFENENDIKPWEMMIDNQMSQANPKSYIGYLAKSATEYYSILPVTKMEKVGGKSGNILAGSIGFEFRDPQGRAIAAVSKLDRGMVFLSRVTPSERFLLANACAAILLQDMIE